MNIIKIIYHKKFYFFTIIYLTESDFNYKYLDLSVVEFFKFINKHLDDSFDFFTTGNVVFV